MSEILKEVVFWGCFLIFNFTFFLPNYLLHYPHASLFPQKWKHPRRLGTGIGMEENPDIFRLSIDMSSLILMTRYIDQVPLVIVSGYFGFMWLFNLYYLAFKKIYEFDPMLINDVRLLKNAVGFLWGEDKIKFIGNVLALLGIWAMLVSSFSAYLSFSVALAPIGFTHFLGVFLLVLIVVVGSKHKYKDYHSTRYRFLFVPFRLIQNLRDSLKVYKTVVETDWDLLEEKRQCKVKLVERPNVYLIFIESYGSILLKEPEISTQFKEEFDSFQNSLKASNWKVKSQLSESISLVGPSWLAYTSVLMGARVASNFKYEFLLKNEKFHKYDTLTKFLQKQGYQSYNLNATKPKRGVATPLDEMASLYGIDEWILRHHVPFKGTKYGFTEGPSDQYVLNYGLEEVIQKKADPFVLFYLTKNSHSPFISPTSPVQDWRGLSDGQESLVGNIFLQRPTMGDYMSSITYQLQFLSDFIVRQGSAKDVFLLIGDHQPHHISNIQKHGLETFVHVISQNESFLHGLEEYGFSPDLPDGNVSALKHEALYSIFMRQIIKTYGPKGAPLPDYEPNGLQF